MARVICAVGKPAKEPYRLAKLERNIYSIEELCYLLVQSAQFLDHTLMDPDLVEWIETQCGLPELAQQLRPLLGRERALAEFVSLILDEVGFEAPEKEDRVRRIVESGQGMEPFAARMRQAAWLDGNARPYEALEEYQAVLRELPEPEREMRTQALCAEGRIYARLFRFRSAADCYEKAYDLKGSREFCLLYLAALRMGLSDSEYLAYIAEHPEMGEASLELEEQMDQYTAEYEASQARHFLQQLRQYREDGLDTNYEIALHQEIRRMKEDYLQFESAAV